MEMLLIRERLWSIVCQRQLRPTPAASSSSSRTRNNNNTTSPEIDAAALEWDENAERATATIFLYLDERAERVVIDIRNPVELWEKLKTTYERKGFSSRFYLWQTLFTLQLADYRKRDEGNAMELYLDAFRLHIQELRSSGAAVSNEIEASVLFNGLDNSYESFIVTTTQSFRQNVNSLADSEIDVEQLVSQLRDEDRRRASGRIPTEIGDPNTGSALYSNRDRKRPWQSNQPPSHQSNQPRLTCNYCNRDGHRQNDCWDLHPHKKQNRQYSARVAQASVAMANATAELAAAGIEEGSAGLF
jgi:hypothetical protein